jgi:hypothetical protein
MDTDLRRASEGRPKDLRIAGPREYLVCHAAGGAIQIPAVVARKDASGHGLVAGLRPLDETVAGSLVATDRPE